MGLTPDQLHTESPPDQFLGGLIVLILPLFITCVFPVYYVYVFMGFHRFCRGAEPA